MKVPGKYLTLIGGILLLIGGLDPLEGSLLVLPGSALFAWGARLDRADRRVKSFRMAAFVLVALGVGALWGLSAMGGFGGTSGRSNAWGLLVVPYLIGWSMELWGPGTPRWLSLLGIAAGAWYLGLAFMAGGVVAAACASLGALTIGGCLNRLARKAKTGMAAVSG